MENGLDAFLYKSSLYDDILFLMEDIGHSLRRNILKLGFLGKVSCVLAPPPGPHNPAPSTNKISI
eukprot:1615648-Ditylum_brightwellii.AAC.1